MNEDALATSPGAHQAAPHRLTISVALCSYNGAQFIAEQLLSILQQTRKPDEIIVFDDASQDKTVEIARRVLELHQGSDVRWAVNVNPRNVGVSKNFSQSAQATTGDVVFLCDQDDIWLPDKIECIAAEFEKDPALTLVHTDACLIGDGGSPLGVGLFDALELRDSELAMIDHGHAFRVLIRRNVVTGATCAFRRTLLDAALPFPEDWIHDEWLGIVAAATGRVKCIKAQLTEYRQHSANQIGIRKRSAREKIRHMFSKRGDFYKRQVHRAELLIRQLGDLPSAADKLGELADWRTHLSFRAALPPSRLKRLPRIHQEIMSGRYSRYSLGFRSVVRDILEAP